MLDIYEHPEALDTIPREMLAQFRWTTGNGYAAWANDLVGRLVVAERVRAQRLLGRPEEAVDLGIEPSKNHIRLAHSIGLVGATAAPDKANQLGATVREKLKSRQEPDTRITLGIILGLIFQGSRVSSLEPAYHDAFTAYMEVAKKKENDFRNENLSYKLKQFGALCDRY